MLGENRQNSCAVEAKTDESRQSRPMRVFAKRILLVGQIALLIEDPSSRKISHERAMPFPLDSKDTSAYSISFLRHL